jgi:hypothetical protein
MQRPLGFLAALESDCGVQGAGRAHCAWGGHFVTCIRVVMGKNSLVLPLVGIKKSRAGFVTEVWM